jgi:hypothetical protein
MFGNSDSLTTGVSIPVPGSYVFQLMADDGQVQTAQTVTVTSISLPILSARRVSNTIEFAWQNTGGAWLLQYQTNPPGAGLGPEWLTTTDAVSSPLLVPMQPDAGSIFYRLILTN